MKRKAIRIAGRITVILIGTYAALLGGAHGGYEILHRGQRPGSLFFDAVSGNSLAADFPGWPGWPAMSVIPDFQAAGIAVLAVAAGMLAWLLLGFRHRHWGRILIGLAAVLCLAGGGFKAPFFGMAAGGIGIILGRWDRGRGS
jgi:hypothetical protein